jgi:hypothetical protein
MHKIETFRHLNSSDLVSRYTDVEESTGDRGTEGDDPERERAELGNLQPRWAAIEVEIETTLNSLSP